MVAIIEHIDQSIQNLNANINNFKPVICKEGKDLKDLIQNRDDLVHFYCNQQARSGMAYLYELTCGVSNNISLKFDNIA